MKQNFTRIAALLAFVSASFTVDAQNLLSNTITGTNPSTANPYSAGQVVASYATSTGIGRGSGITAANVNDAYAASGFNSGAFDANDYFSITITPNASSHIEYSTLSYSATMDPGGSPSFAVRSSVDNYAANLGTVTDTGGTIDLKVPAFQNITTPITFRFYAWGASNAGKVYQINNFSFVSLGTSGATPLPLNLLSFGGRNDNGAVKLNWSATCEKSLLTYEIERSEGGAFSRIATLDARNSGCNVTETYSYTDASVTAGHNYQYRLHITETDGSASYSAVSSFRIAADGLGQPAVLNNPVAAQLQTGGILAGDVIRISDLNGRTLQTLVADGINNTINVSNLAPGMYILQVSGNGTASAIRFVKN